MSKAVRPLHDRVIVKRATAEEISRGGIIIPDTAKEKPQEGQVTTVGKGRITKEGQLIPIEVNPGEKILFGKYAGTEIKLDGEEYLIIIRETDILDVVEH